MNGIQLPTLTAVCFLWADWLSPVTQTNSRRPQSHDSGEEVWEEPFYRFNVFPIEIPPLRERREDIPELLNYFLAKLSGQMQKMQKQIQFPLTRHGGADELPMERQHPRTGKFH